ncbi:hypothetical protein ACHAWU_007668 [Discostella pseudostelligera]|uniref:Uncharacterized protein n=1 Tax=Discostella pseudostelligera TaxID=259834 RepID=A0ABD3M7A8_9STRA
MMKNATFAALLALNLFHLPDGTHSFTTTPSASIRRSMSTNLHGLPPLPGFLTRNKATSDENTTVTATTDRSSDIPVLPGEGGAISSDMTEMALETTTTYIAEKSDGEELSETQTLLQKVKQAGTAGAISYALWELGFWGVSIPICVVGYYKLTGHWPDISNKEDMEKVGAEAFAFVNFARLAVPLRIGLALSTTPWIDENIVQKFMKKDDGEA